MHANKVAAIRKAHSHGYKPWAIARDHGVSVETVQAILHPPRESSPDVRPRPDKAIRRLRAVATRLRAEGYSEAAILAAFGEVA